jgi:tetratricopeptide (TPR) repeat protein
MFASKLITKRRRLNLLLVAIAVFSAATSVIAQPQNPEERQKAIDTYESQNLLAALPLLEKVALAYPNDTAVLSRLGFALYANSVDEKDTVKRKQMRDRARAILQKSVALGDQSNLTQIILDALAGPDSTQLPFSKIQAAEAAIREGETAFMRGDMDAAIAAYKRALDADPNLYDAALYAGDSEFKKAHNSTDAQFRKDHFAAAGVWFAKAIAINPDRETAYRYWGDALDAAGNTNEARDKFIEAIVAWPYDRRPYVGLTQWAQRHNVQLGHPRIDIPSDIASKKPGEVTITIDESMLKGSASDGSAAWLLYGMVRASWANKKDGTRSDEFAKAYPKESVYRHSLAEEVAALRAVAASLQEQMKDNRVTKPTVSLENVKKLNDAGLLEAYILFVRPDDGIVRDYPAYRAANREKLRKYWSDIVILRN